MRHGRGLRGSVTTLIRIQIHINELASSFGTEFPQMATVHIGLRLTRYQNP
jgi:hypothetical protein